MVELPFWEAPLRMFGMFSSAKHIEHTEHAESSQIYKQANRRVPMTHFLVLGFIDIENFSTILQETY